MVKDDIIVKYKLNLFLNDDDNEDGYFANVDENGSLLLF
jgi:hypothetical protein